MDSAHKKKSPSPGDVLVIEKPAEPLTGRLPPCSEGGHVFWIKARINADQWPCLRGCGYIRRTQG